MRTIGLAALVILAGCASSGPVAIGKDTFMITKQSAGGAFVSPGSIKVEIIREATAHCSSISKVFQIVNTNETSASPGRPPSAEVNYMCLSEGDHEIARPKLRKEADTVIEVRK